MRRLTSLICSIAFCIAGICLAVTNGTLTAKYHNTANAAEIQPTNAVIMQYPKDLLLSHTNDVRRDTIHDTIPLEIHHDTVHIVKYKTKWKTKKTFVPDTIASQAHVDTLYVSKPVIVIPVVKEEAKDSTILAK